MSVKKGLNTEKKGHMDTPKEEEEDRTRTDNIMLTSFKIERGWPHWDTKICGQVPPVAHTLLLCNAFIPLSQLNEVKETWIEAKVTDDDEALRRRRNGKYAASRHCIPDPELAALFTTLVQWHKKRAVDPHVFFEHMTSTLRYASSILPRIPKLQQADQHMQGGANLFFLAQVWEQFVDSFSSSSADSLLMKNITKALTETVASVDDEEESEEEEED